MAKKPILILIFTIFLISRLYVLANPPYGKHYDKKTQTWDVSGYSDVKHDSERYANMWHYGLTPYRLHLYEYPPAAIPLVYLPLLVDLNGLGYYYLNYRVGIFLLESIFFIFLIKAIHKIPTTNIQKWLAISFYITIGALAKDFWYDGLDLVFLGTFTLGIIWRLLYKTSNLKHRIIAWVFFAWSIATKLLTIPLGLPFLVLARKNLKKEMIAIILGFIIIWGIPLGLYRSSLSVFLFFHAVRPLKYEAFPTMIVRVINEFTHTEIPSNIAPHFPVLGPVSSAMEKIVAIEFPCLMLASLLFGSYLLIKNNITDKSNNLIVYQYLIKITLIFIFTFFLSSKIFSRPFHIWYIPLITIYPFKDIKKQLLFIICATIMILLDTTPYIKLPPLTIIGSFTLERLRDIFRFIPAIILLIASIKLNTHARS